MSLGSTINLEAPDSEFSCQDSAAIFDPDPRCSSSFKLPSLKVTSTLL